MSIAQGIIDQVEAELADPNSGLDESDRTVEMLDAIADNASSEPQVDDNFTTWSMSDGSTITMDEEEGGSGIEFKAS